MADVRGRRWMCVIATIAALGAAGTAHAADGDLVVDGCLVRTGVGALGCTATLASNPHGLALSPDGKQVYAGLTVGGPVTAYPGLQIFDRDPATGVLAPRTGVGSCFAAPGATVGCTPVSGIDGASGVSGVAVSPDGRSVFATSLSGVFSFARDVNTGALTFVNCIGMTFTCTFPTQPVSPVAVAVSPNSANVYVRIENGLVVLDRNPTTLALAQKAGQNGCFMHVLGPFCQTAPGLIGGASRLAVSQDGKHLYVPFSQPGGIAIFERFADGTLRAPLPGAGECISTDGTGGDIFGGCIDGPDSLATATVATLSSNGGSLYVGGSSAITSFARNPTTGALTSIGCHGAVTGCAPVAGPALSQLADLAVTPDGTELAAVSGQSLRMFRRATATGVLTQRVGRGGCASHDGSAGTCQTLAGIGASKLAIASDSLRIYVSGAGLGLLGTLVRDFAPVCQAAAHTTAHNTPVTIPLTCSDVNGDALTLATTAPGRGTLASAGPRSVRYSPVGGFSGTDSFTLRATARGVTSAAVTISIAVAGPPVGSGGGTPLTAIDRDGDGFNASLDCDDANPAIRPGALEVKGNSVDENCDGLVEPFPQLTSGVVTIWNVKSTAFTLRALQIGQPFPKGWKVSIRCAGTRCPFKSKSLKPGKIKRGASSVIASLPAKQRRFRAGQTIEVWITAPGFNTKVARYALRRGRIPLTEPMCALPGAKRAQKSCT